MREVISLKICSTIIEQLRITLEILMVTLCDLIKSRKTSECFGANYVHEIENITRVNRLIIEKARGVLWGQRE